MSTEDIAQEIELADWERNNKRREVLKFAPTDKGYGSEFCDECDEKMPEARREYGRRLCTTCQDRKEKLIKRGLQAQ